MGQKKSMIGKDAPINEIIGLLDAYGKKELSTLNKLYPKSEKILKIGKTLGNKKLEVKELRVRTEACKLGLKLIIDKGEKILPGLKSKLKMLNNTQFVSQIIVALSGASILVFLQDNFDESIKLLIGILTLIAGLLSLYVQHRSGTIVLGENSLIKIYNDLTDYKLKSDHFLEELTIIEKLNFSSSVDEISKIISQSNEISLKMKKLIQKI